MIPVSAPTARPERFTVTAPMLKEAVLETVQVGKPLYLTKNGRGCYTVMNIDEQEEQREKAEKYDRMQAQLRLMCELAEGRRSGEEEGWISSEDVRNHFRARANAK